MLVLHRHRDVRQDDLLAAVLERVAATDGFEHEHWVRRAVSRAELKRERRRDMRGGDALHLFERLHATLRLACLRRLGLEARDERLQVRNRLLLLLEGALLQRQLLAAQDFELTVVATVTLDLLILDVQRDVADLVEKFAIVRNHDERTGVTLEPVFEPDDGVQIQVVGRLVEQQQIGRAHERLRQIQAHAPPAREAGDRQLRLRQRKAEAEQQRLAAGRGGVPVGVGEGRVGVGLGMAVVSDFRRRNIRFDLTQPRVAVENVVERSTLDRWRLLHHMRQAPATGHEDIAPIRVQLPAQQREQRGLAGAVGADEADALARVERDGGVLEERLGAAREGKVFESDHEKGRGVSGSVRPWPARRACAVDPMRTERAMPANPRAEDGKTAILPVCAGECDARRRLATELGRKAAPRASQSGAISESSEIRPCSAGWHARSRA